MNGTDFISLDFDGLNSLRCPFCGSAEFLLNGHNSMGDQFSFLCMCCKDRIMVYVPKGEETNNFLKEAISKMKEGKMGRWHKF